MKRIKWILAVLVGMFPGWALASLFFIGFLLLSGFSVFYFSGDKWETEEGVILQVLGGSTAWIQPSLWFMNDKPDFTPLMQYDILHWLNILG